MSSSNGQKAVSVWTSHDQLSPLAVRAPHQVADTPAGLRPIFVPPAVATAASNGLALQYYNCYGNGNASSAPPIASSPTSAADFDLHNNNNTAKMEVDDSIEKPAADEVAVLQTVEAPAAPIPMRQGEPVKHEWKSNLEDAFDEADDDADVDEEEELYENEEDANLNDDNWLDNLRRSRPRSASGALHRPPRDHALARHPLLSPPHSSNVEDVRFDTRALRALSPRAVGIDTPTPSRRALFSFAHPDEPTSSTAVMNEDETARILLRISENLSRSSSATTPPTPTSTSSRASTSRAERSPKKSRTFFRPPGRKAPGAGSEVFGALTCRVCGFSCSSRFHYNSHMNTHGCHRCGVLDCNYTSRTEGRLKKHMKDSHTEEQRNAALLAEQMALLSSIVKPKATFNFSSPSANASTSASSAAPLEQIKALTEGCSLFKEEDDKMDADGRQPSTSRSSATRMPKASAKASKSALKAGNSRNPSTTKRSSGKPKRYVCKQCNHVSTNKDDLWRHNKTHIPMEKQLTCPQCEFVTEYKHHLQYHIRNHVGSKPFKCDKCEYTCVNKSMLNSHKKSHTPIYNFKCLDCSYMTKYCHSLKMHLQKYHHRRAPGRQHGVEGSEMGDETVADGEMDPAMNYETVADTSNNVGVEMPGPSNRPHAVLSSFPSSSGTQPLESFLMQPQQFSAQLPQQQPESSNADTALTQQLLLQRAVAVVAGQLSLPQSTPPPVHVVPSEQRCGQCDFTTLNKTDMYAHVVNAHNPYALSTPQQQQPQQQQQDSQRSGQLTYQLLMAMQNQQQAQLLPRQLQLQQMVMVRSMLRQAQEQLGVQQALQNVNSEAQDAPMAVDESGAAAAKEESHPEPASSSVAVPSAAPPAQNATNSGDDSAGELIKSPSANGNPTSPTSSNGSKKANGKLDKISLRLMFNAGSPDTEGRLSSPEERHAEGEERKAAPRRASAPAAPTTDVNSSVSAPAPMMRVVLPTPPSDASPPVDDTYAVKALNNNEAPSTAVLTENFNRFVSQFVPNSHVAVPNAMPPMPYTCNYCMLAFHDHALYQIHFGFHAYDSPFKCNRCGYRASNSLTFNLHLYQDRH